MKMENTRIIKVKNPDGEWSKCSICGAPIKHIYILADSVDIPENHFGVECAKHFGISKKEIKTANSRRKIYDWKFERGQIEFSEKDYLMGFVK